MKRLNTKGMTVVELLLSFTILIIVVLGMFNLVLGVKDTIYEEQLFKDFNNYSSTMQHIINKDLLKCRFYLKDIDNNGYYEIEDIVGEEQANSYTLKFPFWKDCDEDGNASDESKDFILNRSNASISYGGTLYKIPNSYEVENFNAEATIEAGDNVRCSSSSPRCFLTVDVTYNYKNDLSTNYGFKIVHVIEKRDLK